VTAPWPSVPLGDVLTERQEIPPPDALAKGEIRVVAKVGFDDGRIDLRTDSETKTGMILIRPGDLVVSGINAAKGAIAVYGGDNTEPIAATIHYTAYVPDSTRACVSYLWWLLRSRTFRDLLLEYVPGGIKTELRAKRLLPIPVPLPSVAEQRRIVARIEALAAKIEEVRNLRRQVAQEVESLSSAAAMAAFDNQSWPRATLEELVGRANLRNGKSVKATGQSFGIQCLRLSALRGGRIDSADVKPVPMAREEAEPFLVRAGDIFVVRGNGSKELVGRAAVVDKPADGVIFPDLFIRVPLDERRVLPRFFVAWWNSPQMRKTIQETAKTTSGIWKINQGHIASFSIPLPPLPEQRRVVAYLDDLRAKVDALKRLQAETAAELDAMLPSILDKAFKGEL